MTPRTKAPPAKARKLRPRSWDAEPSPGTVFVGFAVPDGAPISAPVAHMVVTGQTQRAGKTTALEGLVSRAAGFSAIAFLTKRGESSFESAPRIRPYFREEVDWMFVASILEATMHEKMKFERSWIIKAVRGARTLADVHANVRRALLTAKGLHESVYLTLDAYLERIVPEIGRVKWADSVAMPKRGLAVMDLRDFAEAMQQLIVRSTIAWVQENTEKTIVVVPEAWKFAPEGRMTPVKLVAESFVRQGAALKNFLWLDSQDITGVDKKLLKQCAVWMLGVQRETNEIARTLAQIPAGVKKPKADAIAALKLGEFFVCYELEAVRTYVQPAWLPVAEALDVAKGRVSVSAVSWFKVKRVGDSSPEEDADVNATEARALEERNAQLERENDELHQRVTALEKAIAAMRTRPEDGESPHVPLLPKHVASRRRDVGADIRERADSLAETWDKEALYVAFKERLLKEAPGLIRVLVMKPEIEVSVTRKTIAVDGQSVVGRVARLYADGFFDQAQGQGDTRNELRRRGPDVNTGSLSKVFAEMLAAGFFVKHGATKYVAVEGAKVRVVES